MVQAVAPSVLRRSADGLSLEIPEARLWGAVLTAIPVVLALMLQAHLSVSPGLVVVIGLAVFGFVFAVISSLHSYLILAYAGSKKAAEDVGFYYAANAAGRLIGILLSGALAQYGSLPACLWGSAAMLTLCLALVFLALTEMECDTVPAWPPSKSLAHGLPSARRSRRVRTLADSYSRRCLSYRGRRRSVPCPSLVSGVRGPDRDGQ